MGADERICALTRRLEHGEELQVSMYPEGEGRGGSWSGPAHRPSQVQCLTIAVWGHPRAMPLDAGPHLWPHELLPVGG